MRESSLLPLINSQSNNNSFRRSRFHWTLLWRFVSRPRLRLYLMISALITIIIITLIHKLTLRNTINTRHHANSRAKLETRTMRTIIGKYVGNKPEWATMTIQNISDELLNTNGYNPDPNIGKDGHPAYLPGYPREELRLLYSINRFNLAASDRISVDRKLPDARKLPCRSREYDAKDLPNTSIIIVFHNEAWSTLARTVHSILNTSPQHLLAEILLVDDASNRTFLGKSLDYYMNNLGSVRGVDIKVLRSKERVGLIKSRLIGVEQAKGQVLTFIDAHCEATKGWLEPLLEQIKLKPKSAACPIIDIINEDTFAFTRSFELHLGAFNWGLNFRWYPISRRELVASNGFSKQGGKVKVTDLIKPFHTPVMAGGLFSIGRQYFNDIGKYDSKMDIWGGENIELSLRIWQCGGEVSIVPCSHVGHIFRKSSPYTFRPGKEVGDILYTNLARVSEVWMDEWRDFFYKMNPIVNRTLHKVGREIAFEDIESRKRLRTDLKCKDFSWFLDNVWPEHFFPKPDRFFGKVKQTSSGRCLQRPTVRIGMGQAAVGAVDTTNCSEKLKSDQLFVFDSNRGFLMTDENICLDSGSEPIPTRSVILSPCNESKRQKWELTDESHLKHQKSGLCLDAPEPSRVQLQVCDSRISSKWTLIEEKWNSKQ